MTDFDKNTWQTPDYFFRWLEMRFHINVDGCANGDNAKCDVFIG